jgi:hypothetical protein
VSQDTSASVELYNLFQKVFFFSWSHCVLIWYWNNFWVIFWVSIHLCMSFWIVTAPNAHLSWSVSM